jgi:hypothetical protein
VPEEFSAATFVDAVSPVQAFSMKIVVEYLARACDSSIWPPQKRTRTSRQSYRIIEFSFTRAIWSLFSDAGY